MFEKFFRGEIYKMLKNKVSVRSVALFLIIATLSVLAVACGAAPTPQTVTVIETVVVTQEVVKEVEGKTVTVIETVVVEKEVEKVVEVEVTPKATSDDRVKLRWNIGTEPPSLDPSLATDSSSINHLTNLFIGLTQFDPDTNDVLPSLATDWSASDDGLVWTFNLRNDVPWVRYDLSNDTVEQVLDDEGNPRMVSAFDIEYGVKRTIMPDTASDYAYVLYILNNAQELNTGTDADGNETALTIDDLGVKAVDDVTIEFTLKQPAGYFPSIASMWVAYPQPSWTIEQFGEKWTEANLINTSGPYVLAEWIHGGSLTMVKNPFWFDADNVQIEIIEGLMIEAESTAFALYENNELDTVGVPLPELDRVKADPMLSEELFIAPTLCTYYYGFTNNKAPMDDVRVRRAFSAAVDRQSVVDNITKGGQVPATTFAPPGIVGAPEPGTLGLGYDLELAQASLQEYLDEMGMTVEEFSSAYDLTLGHNTSEGHAKIAAAVQQMWKDNLGVDVRVENQEWRVYLTTIDHDTPLEDSFSMWRLGWCADYPDENNWVHEVFNSEEGANNLRRNCVDDTCTETSGPSRFDELTVQAAQETDPAVRAELYAEAEDILAGEEVAYIPIYHYTTVNVAKPWLNRNYPTVSGLDFFNWSIDVDAQSEAIN
jgi:oligopeptide transport system substrate-binding protein